ncbi:hypothetical protein RND81_02G093300 [Saponaria officinalis]|uniref:CRAL-TRIO domain-containing protein n=1 Tax=Saponaria officinalis TaxID=3572 RepID=A0AAW1MKY2_SAPOF
MSTDSKNASILEERLKKIAEVRAAVGQLPEKLSRFASDETVARYLRARNWNVKKATKMLKETLKWRSEYKTEDICWEDIASEAETGKVYRSTSVDKKGRPVLVMRPSCQNTNSVAGQIKYVVYCMENAILNMPPNQEQMIWLVDFWNFGLANVSIKSAKETAHVLQNHYPERLGIAIMYNPPRIFEQFYRVVKPFLEPKTRNKVKFVYTDDPNSKKIMEELFNMDQLESAFGGKSTESFDIHKFAQRMKEDDNKKRSLWEKGLDPFASTRCASTTKLSSSSDNDDQTEEEESDDRSTPLSPAGESLSFSPDIGLSVTAMSLADHGDVKA